MSVSTRPEDGFLRIVLAGHYSFQEVLDLISNLVTSPDGGPSLGLLDVQASEELRTSEELRVLAAHLAELGAFKRLGVLADAISPRFGLARMLEVFAEDQGVTVRAFRVESEAVDWLAAPA